MLNNELMKKLKIFVDFDGTISTRDVGEAIFREFGGEKEVNQITEKLLNDEISAKQCWLSLCDTIENIDPESLNNFIHHCKIDPSFHDFNVFCAENNIEYFVLSDGFDYYIKRIFQRENLGHVKVYSNKLTFSESNKLVPSFPYQDESCTTSANCKRNHIITHSSDDDYTVYIGDGNSDKYTAQYCDFIFAKDGLLKYCEKERITYFPFENFNDVIIRLESMLSKKRLKKRHQAELKRKEAYMME